MFRVVVLIAFLFSLTALLPGASEAYAASVGPGPGASAAATSAKSGRAQSRRSVRDQKKAVQRELNAAAKKADRDVAEFLGQIDTQQAIAQSMGNRFSLPRTPEIAERAHELMRASANARKAKATMRHMSLREFAASNNIRMKRLRPRRARPISLDPPAEQSEMLSVPTVEVRPAKSSLPPGGQPLAYQSRNAQDRY